jgi:Acyl-CoA carboxylase epsilon subunit
MAPPTGPPEGADPDPQPFLRVVRGDPTPEELAVLVAVLTSVAAPGPSGGGRETTRQWNAPRRLHGVVHPHGPGGWRASGLPR